MKYRPALIDPVKIYALREILYGAPNREQGGRCAENPWSLLLCKSDMLPLRETAKNKLSIMEGAYHNTLRIGADINRIVFAGPTGIDLCAALVNRW